MMKTIMVVYIIVHFVPFDWSEGKYRKMLLKMSSTVSHAQLSEKTGWFVVLCQICCYCCLKQNWPEQLVSLVVSWSAMPCFISPLVHCLHQSYQAHSASFNFFTWGLLSLSGIRQGDVHSFLSSPPLSDFLSSPSSFFGQFLAMWPFSLHFWQVSFKCQMPPSLLSSLSVFFLFFLFASVFVLVLPFLWHSSPFSIFISSFELLISAFIALIFWSSFFSFSASHLGWLPFARARYLLLNLVNSSSHHRFCLCASLWMCIE